MTDDADRFRALFDAQFDDLWRFARRRTGSGPAADDIVAQVFAVAWRRRTDLPSSSERLWLFGVARRVLANERRSTVRRERLVAKLAAEPTGHPAAQPSRGSAADVGDLGALDIEVPGLDDLTSEEREAVLLRYWDDLSVRDIADLVGCSANAVSLRLHRARRKLSASIDGKPGAARGHVESEPGSRSEFDGHR